MLILDGVFFKSYIGKPDAETWDSLLVYLTRSGYGDRIHERLSELHPELWDNDAAVSPHSCLEIIQHDRGVDIICTSDASILPNLDLSTRRQVLELDPGQHPSALYLIPFIPADDGNPEVIAEQAFRELLRSATLGLFRSLGPGRQYDLDNDFLVRAIRVWPIWRQNETKRSLRTYARTFLRQIFSSTFANQAT